LSFVEERVEEFARNKDEARDRLRAFQEKFNLYVPLGTAASATGASEAFLSPQLIAEYTGMILEKQLEIQSLLEYLPEDAPQVRRLRNEINLLQKTIRDLRFGGEDSLSINTIPESQINQVLLEYQDYARELQLQETLYSQFLLQAESIRIQNSDKTSTFQVIAPAEIPEKKSAPSRAMILIIGTAGAFFLAVFTAFFREYLNRVKEDPEEGAKLVEIKKSLSLFPSKEKN
jgi:capsule polysaccharide export protein KpsE/RkpR